MEDDTLGKRINKIIDEITNRYLWDGNVLLHQWEYKKGQEAQTSVNDLGEVYLSQKEAVDDLVTWIYQERTFVPSAKIQGEEQFSIISDYLGRPVQSYDQQGRLVWQTDYDIYGKLRNLQGEKTFIPFRQLGQYEDPELDGLYYNRFRYYDANTGLYLSQDPIGLAGNNPTLYAYVHDSNTWIDPFGLDCRLRDSNGKFRRALTAVEELNVLGGLNGKSRSKIENRLRKRGYTSVPARSGGNVWTKPMADGNTVVVRVDPAMSRTPARGFADEVPHAHKEVVSTSDISAGDYGRGASVTKYDDLNNVSTNPRDIHIPITW